LLMPSGVVAGEKRESDFKDRKANGSSRRLSYNGRRLEQTRKRSNGSLEFEAIC